MMSSIAFASGASIGPSLSAPSFSAPRLRITTRGRVVVALLVAVPLALGATTLGLGAAGAAAGTHGGSASSFHYITVDPGESLWQVAQSVAPAADPRDVIADIVSLNDLASSDVQPGQRLAIPLQYER